MEEKRKEVLIGSPSANCMWGPVGPCKMLMAMTNERTPVALASEIPTSNLRGMQ